MGRNMFSPLRGPWADDQWKGWWGDDPPYHCDVFVVTHHARASIEMRGGTVFHFPTDGFAAALRRARASAKGKDVRVGGGVATIREGLQARLIDDVHLAVSPVLLGRGEALFEGLDLASLGYKVVDHTATARATHVILRRED